MCALSSGALKLMTQSLSVLTNIRAHIHVHTASTHTPSALFTSLARSLLRLLWFVTSSLPPPSNLNRLEELLNKKKNPNTCFHYEFRMTLRLFGTGYYWHNCCLMGVPMEIAACELIVLIAESNVKDRLNVPQTVFISAERFQMLARWTFFISVNRQHRLILSALFYEK